MNDTRKLQIPTDVPRSLPFSVDAEKGLLSSILLSPTEVIAAVREHACKNSFYIPAHQIVYELLLELSYKNRAIDFVVLRQALRDRGQLEEIGDAEYLSHLYEFVPTPPTLSTMRTSSGKESFSERPFLAPTK